MGPHAPQGHPYPPLCYYPFSCGRWVKAPPKNPPSQVPFLCRTRILDPRRHASIARRNPSRRCFRRHPRRLPEIPVLRFVSAVTVSRPLLVSTCLFLFSDVAAAPPLRSRSSLPFSKFALQGASYENLPGK